tara:strand:+ start:2050 stop:2793 length:744 start_codon:yes stop_codon:yes gene_type:complete
MSEEFKLPTETIELPSKGLLYPADSELAKGTIEIKYMTAKEEDILTNENYIKQGTVIDKLLQSVIVTKINYSELLLVDKDAIMVAARILGYGKDYEFTYDYEKVTIDLTELEDKTFNEKLIAPGKNEFSFKLPFSKNEITFKLLTEGDERKIQKELKGLKKIDKQSNPEISTRLKHLITSVNGDNTSVTIRKFVDNYLIAKDARALRQYMDKISPGVNMKFDYESPEGEIEEGVSVPIGITFFWPDA